jgi:hypothetical protein
LHVVVFDIYNDVHIVGVFDDAYDDDDDDEGTLSFSFTLSLSLSLLLSSSLEGGVGE